MQYFPIILSFFFLLATQTLYLHRRKLKPSIFVPEKALAALTRHGVEVEASGFVATNTTDSWHIPIELISGHSGRTHNRGLHH